MRGKSSFPSPSGSNPASPHSEPSKCAGYSYSASPKNFTRRAPYSELLSRARARSFSLRAFSATNAGRWSSIFFISDSPNDVFEITVSKTTGAALSRKLAFSPSARTSPTPPATPNVT